MPTTDSSPEQPSATPSFANPYALSTFATGARGGEEFARQYARYAQDSAALMEQIAQKAPQLAAVLDQLTEASLQRRVDLDAAASAPLAPAQSAARSRPQGSLLDTAAGLLSHAFPGVAPLFHGCRAFLQMKMIKNNNQA